MASTAVPPARAFYGPISAAILGFDWEDEEDEVLPRGGADQIPTDAGQEPQRPAPNPQGIGATLGYFAFNPALLGDFDDDAASEASGRATNGGSVMGEEWGGVAPTETPRPWPPTPLVVGTALSTTRREQANPEETRAQDAARRSLGRDARADRTESSRPNNPYAAAIEEKHNAMTVAFLRIPTGKTPLNSSSVTPDDLGYAPLVPAACPANPFRFGQRYQVTEETASVTITNQRRLPDILSGDRECIICTDTKPVADFPTVAITKACTHEPTTCVVCVATSIRTDLNSRLWNEIKCPECRETLEYDDVQRFADDETKER